MRFDVEREYAKHKDLKREDVIALQEWAERQPHLPKISEYYIILFLHSCYYRNEAAKATIDNFYTARTHAPEFFANRNMDDKVNKDLQSLLYAPLPFVNNEGHRVLYACLIDPNPDKYTFNNQIKCFDMSSSLFLADNGCDIGFHCVTDMKGVTFGHVTKLNLLSMKKFLFFLQEATPVRIKGFHFINIVPFMDKVMALMRPFMKKELMDVLHLHTDNFETLYKFIPQRCLPKDYGGDAPSIADLYEKQKADFKDPENVTFFLEQEKLIVNEALRPGKPKDPGAVFGVEGTFKKLDID